jgi:hypothetical protein
MKSVTRCVLALSLTAFSGVLSIEGAFSQSPDDLVARFQGTLFARALPEFRGGQLTSCLLEFSYLGRDATGGPPRLFAASGSFGFMGVKGAAIAPILKLVVNDISGSETKLTPNAPSAAYLSFGNRTNVDSVLKSVPSDTPGALFTIFKNDETIEAYMNALTIERRIKILFSRRPGAMDIPVELDLRVQETKSDGSRIYSDKIADDVMACVDEMINQLKN